MRTMRGALLAASVVVAAAGAALPAGAAIGASDVGEAWVARYNGTPTGTDQANSVAVSLDETRVFTTGRSAGTGSGYDYATVAHSAATGASLWLQRYNGTANGTDEANAVVVSPNGARVFVTGYSDGTTSDYDYATAAYDAASGAPLWVKRYNGLGNQEDYATSVVVSPDSSRVFVTGYSFGGAIGYDFATVAYDAATGTPLWTRRYDGTAHSTDEANAIATSPDGTKVYVTGYANMSGSGYDYVTQAYDAATGSPLWGKTYNGPGNSSDYAYDLAVSPDGSKVFVTGQSAGIASDYDYATVALNAATGSSLWFRRYNGPDNDADYGQSIAASPDGAKVYVTGYSDGGASGYDYATLAYVAATGSPVWGQRFNGPGNSSDYAFGVGVTPDGIYVYATGYAPSGASGIDYATLAYNAVNGGLVGLRRYNGPANGSDYGRAIAVGAVRAYVTGESYGGAKGDDYATVAYNI